MTSKFINYNKSVKIWLFIGLIMLFVQIIVGGITRLTESGLSITKWEVLTGSIPPMNEGSWLKEFDLYKSTPQFREINEGMSLSDFKFIYFWEFIHRFWARIMGFVFIIPFIYFYIKGYFDRYLLKRLFGVFMLAVLAATFGWIMVKSGLNERPWVNAYKLSFHLCIALSVFVYLLWTWLNTLGLNNQSIKGSNSIMVFLVLLWVQLFLGGMMSGMKAAVVYPEWPLMHESLIPNLLFHGSEWSFQNFMFYDQNIFMPTLVQFLHRFNGYVLVFNALYIIYISNFKNSISITFAFVLCLQVLLGIFTLLNSAGEVTCFIWCLTSKCGCYSTFLFVLFIFYVK